MNNNFKSIIIAVNLFLALSALVSAAPGDLDPNFGNGGIVVNTYPFHLDIISDLAIQTDGRIVVAGHVSDGSAFYFGVVRYNPNGSLDTTFGGTGKVLTSVGGTGGSASEAAIQADGKIVVVGSSRATPDDANNAFGIVRYNTDGSLDNSFGGTGKIIIPVGLDSSANSVAIQTDDKIVAAGAGYNGTSVDFAVVRLKWSLVVA